MRTPTSVAFSTSENLYPRVCILGGGFGGLYTALSLQRFPRLHITLIDRNDHILFTPLLYELITDELQTWQIAPKLSQLVNDKKVNIYRDQISNLDLKSRQVFLQNGGAIGYDYLVIAVGMKNRFDETPGAREYALNFRTLQDTLKLKKKLATVRLMRTEPAQICIVGGGPSGVELAGKISDYLGRQGEVHLMTQGEQIIKTFKSSTRTTAQKALDRRKVRVSVRTKVRAVGPDRIEIEQANQRASLPADLVIWATGTEAISWILNLNCEHNADGQLLVEPTLQLRGYPEVFALGDVAEIVGSSQIPKTAQSAYQQGPVVAKNLRALVDRRRLKRFRYLHLGEMMTLGVNDAAVSSFGLHIKGRPAFLFRKLVYLIRMPTLHHRLKVVLSWLKSWCKARVNRIFARDRCRPGKYPRGIQ